MTIRLFKVMTDNGVSLVGLTYGQIAMLNTNPQVLELADNMLEKLAVIGRLPAWRYVLRQHRNGSVLAEPVQPTTLAAGTIRDIQPYRPIFPLSVTPAA